MGAYSLALWAALIPAPLLGTFLLERAGPGALWGAALTTGLAATAVFTLMSRRAETAPAEAG